MARYKMNQEAINELVQIHEVFKMMIWPVETILERLDEGVLLTLTEIHEFNLDEIKEYSEEADRLRRVLRGMAQNRFDHFRCDIDESCCNRIEYEPLDVEVVA